jgi:hypothetical protein
VASPLGEDRRVELSQALIRERPGVDPLELRDQGGFAVRITEGIPVLDLVGVQLRDELDTDVDRLEDSPVGAGDPRTELLHDRILRLVARHQGRRIGLTSSSR